MKNPADATGRNIKASQNRDAALLREIKSLKWRMDRAEGLLGLKKIRKSKVNPDKTPKAGSLG